MINRNIGKIFDTIFDYAYYAVIVVIVSLLLAYLLPT
jgi:hypothetical protein